MTSISEYTQLQITTCNTSVMNTILYQMCYVIYVYLISIFKYIYSKMMHFVHITTDIWH